MTQFEWQIEALIQVGFTETQRVCVRDESQKQALFTVCFKEKESMSVNPLQYK